MHPNGNPATPSDRLVGRSAVVATVIVLGLTCAAAAQSPRSGRVRSADPQVPASAPSVTKPSPSVPLSSPPSETAQGPRSMLEQPAAEAKVLVQGDRLSIEAANASLSEIIRQVGAKTGMQVEGNSREERVYGVYGPGSPPEVLSALLYDSGYNVMMVGRMTDGAPRRLLLSPRAAGAAPSANVAARQSSREDDDDGEPAAEQAPPAQPGLMGGGVNSGLQPASNAAPGAANNPNQVKSPQQMLEELQRMNRGQQPQELPRDNQN